MKEQRRVFITGLMRSCNLRCKRGFGGSVMLDDNMSGLEPVPRDDWLYFGITALQKVARPGMADAAFIGSGNGIETIAALRIFRDLQDVYVTDLLPDILPQIEANVRATSSGRIRNKRLVFLAGRDCEPLPNKVDLIYGNLPLVTVDAETLGRPLSTTTLADADAYRHLVPANEYDPLLVYSLLSQLGFLLSARSKLKEGGRIVTLIGGRVPTDAIELCFQRAGLSHSELFCGFKRQSDPQFLADYKNLELTRRIRFSFYNYSHAADILDTLGMRVPGVISGLSSFELRVILRNAEISASEAYDLYRIGIEVGHIAIAFEAWSG